MARARGADGRWKAEGSEKGSELDIPTRGKFVYNESNLTDAKKAEVHDFICEVMRLSKDADLRRKRLKSARNPDATSQELIAGGEIMACQKLLDWLCARYGSGSIAGEVIDGDQRTVGDDDVLGRSLRRA